MLTNLSPVPVRPTARQIATATEIIQFNENDLLVDIFSLNDLETDTVRLNASTIKQLFEDTNYKLDEYYDWIV